MHNLRIDHSNSSGSGFARPPQDQGAADDGFDRRDFIAATFGAVWGATMAVTIEGLRRSLVATPFNPLEPESQLSSLVRARGTLHYQGVTTCKEVAPTMPLSSSAPSFAWPVEYMAQHHVYGLRILGVEGVELLIHRTNPFPEELLGRSVTLKGTLTKDPEAQRYHLLMKE